MWQFLLLFHCSSKGCSKEKRRKLYFWLSLLIVSCNFKNGNFSFTLSNSIKYHFEDIESLKKYLCTGKKNPSDYHGQLSMPKRNAPELQGSQENYCIMAIIITAAWCRCLLMEWKWSDILNFHAVCLTKSNWDDQPEHEAWKEIHVKAMQICVRELFHDTVASCAFFSILKFSKLICLCK